MPLSENDPMVAIFDLAAAADQVGGCPNCGHTIELPALSPDARKLMDGWRATRRRWKAADAAKAEAETIHFPKRFHRG